MNLSTFTENTSNPNLTRAVIKQFGRWTDWQESADDIANYGATGGVNGFIYYTDTVAFYEANKGNIHALAREMIAEFNDTTYDDFDGAWGYGRFVASFGCVDLEPCEVVDAMLEGESNEDYTTVANALAWFALEEAAREYVAQVEG